MQTRTIFGRPEKKMDLLHFFLAEVILSNAVYPTTFILVTQQSYNTSVRNSESQGKELFFPTPTTK